MELKEFTIWAKEKVLKVVSSTERKSDIINAVNGIHDIKTFSLIPMKNISDSIAPSFGPSRIPVTPSEAPSVAIAEPSTSPTSILDKEPDCDALLSGNFPSIPSDRVDYITFDYKAELFLNQGFSFNNDRIINGLQDVASNVVSAGAAGCYDVDSGDRARFLYAIENQFIRRVGSSNYRVYYGHFTMLEEVEGGKRKEEESKKRTYSFFVTLLPFTLYLCMKRCNIHLHKYTSQRNYFFCLSLCYFFTFYI